MFGDGTKGAYKIRPCHSFITLFPPVGANLVFAHVRSDGTVTRIPGHFVLTWLRGCIKTKSVISGIISAGGLGWDTKILHLA
jgi:hypothetical protein